MAGETVSNEEVARGRRIVQRFEIRRRDGGLAVVSEHVRLLPDLAKMGAKAGDRPPESPSGAVIAGKTLTPGDVATFSRPVGNDIHFDPGFAARYGYRAPLAQGLMTMTWMVGHVAEAFRGAGAARLTARFRRPVFWDDALTLYGERDAAGAPVNLVAVNAEGRSVCDLRVEI
jgi:acyl dehydratase